MNFVTRTQQQENYLEKLANGDIHLVTYAEEGASNFTVAMMSAFNLGSQNVKTICRQINSADETGTLWPHAKVTAIPKRFCRKSLDDARTMRRCIRDAFVANRDYCHTSKMLFDFTGKVKNASAIEDEILNFSMNEFDRAPLNEVEVWFDDDPLGDDYLVIGP